MTECEDLHELLIESVPPLPNDCMPPSLVGLQKIIRIRRRRGWVFVLAIATILCTASINWVVPTASETTVEATTLTQSITKMEPLVVHPKHVIDEDVSLEPVKVRDASEDGFRVIETWTTAVPVWYQHPESNEPRQGWQIQEFHRPVNPRSLGSSERGAVYRVLFDRAQPPGPQL